MAVECALDFNNKWGYIYCDICEDVVLIGMMVHEEIVKEYEEFKKDHRHNDNL